MKNNNIQKKEWSNIIKFFLLTVFFILSLTVIYLLTTKISETNLKKNVLLKYNTEITAGINTLSNSISLIQSHNKVNFELLKKEKKNINSAISGLKNINKQAIFLNNSTTTNIVNSMAFLWKDILFDINSLIDNQEEITNLYETLAEINSLITQTKSFCKKFFEEILILNLTTNKILLAQQSIWITDRLGMYINNYINGVQSTEISVDLLKKDISSLLKLTSTFKNGNAATNFTKIEDKKAIAYLSQIDINVHQISVLIKSIDRGFATIDHVKSMANSIQQSLLSFNDICLKLIDATVNDNSTKNIFQYIYSLIYILIIFTVLVVIYLFKYKPSHNNIIVAKNNENIILAKLTTDIEKLAQGNFNIKLTPDQEYKHLINAINNYTKFIIDTINNNNAQTEKIIFNLDKIIKDNIDYNKYSSLKNNCLTYIKKTVGATSKIVEQYDIREKTIINNIEKNNVHIKKIIPLTAKLNDLLHRDNSKTKQQKPNDFLVEISDYISSLAEIQNNIEIFKINSEINISKQEASDNTKQLDNLDAINNKVIELKTKLVSSLQTNSTVRDENSVADTTENSKFYQDTINEINTLLAASDKLSKHSLLYLVNGIENKSAELEKSTTDHLKLLDKAFTKLLGNHQIGYKIINKIQELINSNSKI